MGEKNQYRQFTSTMNQRQVTSIILSVLLASTLGHEYIQHHHLAHEAKALQGHARNHQEVKAHHGDARSALLHHQARSNHHRFRNEDQECEWVCEDENGNEVGGDIKVIIKEENNLVVVANISASVAIGFSLEAGLVILLHGETGAAIVINVQTQIGYYIKGGVWLSSKQSIEDYIGDLKRCTDLWELGTKSGTRFDIKAKVKAEITKLVIVVLVSLGVEVAGAASAALKILIEISKTVLVTHKEAFKVIIKSAGNLAVKIKGGVEALVATVAGIAELFAQVKGGISVVIEKGIKLDIAAILGAQNGIKALVAILVQISGKIQISELLGNIAHTPEKILGILVKIAGNVAHGVDGIILILHHVILLVKKETTDVTALVSALIRVSASLHVHADIKVELEASLEAIIEVLKKDVSEVAKAVVKFLVGIKEGNLVIGGVNIGHILQILLKGVVKGALALIIGVLIALKGVVDVVKTIPALLLGLLKLLESVVGIRILVTIVPSIKISSSVISGGTVDIRAIITQNVSIKDILSGGLNIEALIKSLPVIGDIYAALTAALQSTKEVSLDLKVLLKKNTSISGAITAWIKSSVGLEVNIGGSGGSSGHGILGGLVGGGGLSFGSHHEERNRHNHNQAARHH